jgi:hypothetical protein
MLFDARLVEPDPHPDPLPKTGEGEKIRSPLPSSGEGEGEVCRDRYFAVAVTDAVAQSSLRNGAAGRSAWLRSVAVGSFAQP